VASLSLFETAAPPVLDDGLAAAMAAVSWHHQIDFGNGLLSAGNTKLAVLQAQSQIYFAADIIRGKTFLDIGCWDGYNSFEAHRLGASRVLATDHFAWSSACWGDRRAFELARAHLAPSVEVLDIDLPELTEERVGLFDVVLFAGVFFHLRHPFAALERVEVLRDGKRRQFTAMLSEVSSSARISGEDIHPGLAGAELANHEGNHGEDVKEAYFYLDATPTHSYLKALYKYPQTAYPYEQILAVNRARSRHEREFELTDTGIFNESRYFDVLCEYAKAGPDDLLIRLTITNRGPGEAPLRLVDT
jgi:SAM-dependent methyltransferase